MISINSLQKLKNEFSLDQALFEETVKIVGYIENSSFKGQLINIGLNYGEIIKIVNTGSTRPIIVALKNNRLAIDKELAQKVIVTPVIENYKKMNMNLNEEKKADLKTSNKNFKKRMNQNMDLKTLSELNPGENGYIKHIETKGMIGQRLLDMGLLPKAKISMERIAPMGDPVWIILDNYQISLRKSEADKITVEV